MRLGLRWVVLDAPGPVTAQAHRRHQGDPM